MSNTISPTSSKKILDLSDLDELELEKEEFGEDNIGEDLTAEEIYELTKLIKDIFGTKS
ncbi:MAG: hypothetical protein J6T96_14680 [Bacteroidales bacterium]|nr:hypothetical protein [Bacteroidales bacterium]